MKFFGSFLVIYVMAFSCNAQRPTAADNTGSDINQPEMAVMIGRAIKLGVTQTGHFQEPFRSLNSYVLVERGKKGEVNRLVVVAFEMGGYFELAVHFDKNGEVTMFTHRDDIDYPERATGTMTILKEAPQGYTGTVQLGWNGEIVQLIEASPSTIKQAKRKRGG